MTPEEKQKLKGHMRSISEILVKNTPTESLKDFESIEKVSSSSQHRLVEQYEFKEELANGKIEALSLDGGKVRVRRPLGESSQRLEVLVFLQQILIY